jgi:hypothetical protein
MAQIIRLRRSSVSGQKPTNSNLELGELALNTTDGKAFMAKSGSLGTSIEELVITNASNTGSINLSGSIRLEGTQRITGSLIVTDGIGYIDTGLIAQNSDLILTSGSNLHVQDTGYISGSFRGDGSQLINIPISGVTGLNTTRIADGNATASISNTEGLRINTKTEITGSLKVSGSIYGDGSNLTNVGYTEKVFYVSEDGSDSNDGKTLSTPFRTIKVAAQAASASLALNPPNPYPYRTSIRVKSGYYVEEAPITLVSNVSLLGDDLRSVVVRPTNGTKGNNLFLMNNGCYAQGLRLEGCEIDDLEDPRSGFFFAFAPGAYISTSPYVQNCSAINTPFNKFYTPLDFDNANPLVGNGPGGMLIDDSVLDPYSPLKSMIVDSYTQVAFNGIGMCARGRGYGQMVSFFTNFSRVGVYCIDGGHASLLNSNTTFGDYGLRSKGLRILVKPDITLVTGTTVDSVASAYIATKKTDIQTYMISQLALYGTYAASYSNTGSTIYASTIKDSGLLIDAICDDLLSPVVARVSQIASGFFVGQDTTTGQTQTLPVQSGFTQGAVVSFPITTGNTGIADDFVRAYQYIREYFVDDPDNLFGSISASTITKVSQLLDVVEDTIQRVIIDEAGGDLLVEFGSLITSTSHDFSYAGSGVNFLGLPINQGGVGETNLTIRVFQESGGRVYYTGGDETGDQYQGNDFVIRQQTGTIEGRTFNKAISAQITPINLALET